MFHTNF